VDKALEQSLTKKNIKSRFKTIKIYGLSTQRQWIGNTRPSKVYTTTININNAKSEEDYTVEEEVENNQQWGEGFCCRRTFLHR
jgi:hypothetical protein